MDDCSASHLLTPREAGICRSGGSVADTLIAASADAIIAVDASGHVVLWNAAAASLFGHRADDVLGRSLDIIVPEAMRGEHAAGMRRICDGAAPRLVGKPVEIFAQRADGTTFPIEMRVCDMGGGGEARFGAIIRDISDRRRLDEQVHNLAMFDQLTMLPNRVNFLKRLERSLACDVETEARAVLMIVDIDGFAEANDAHGYAKCDELLCEIAVRLKRLSVGASGQATVARIGPKKFGLLIAGSCDFFAAVAAAEKVREAVKDLANEEAIAFAASVGIAIAPTHGSTPTKLFASADFALRRAQLDGGDRRQLFEPRHYEIERRRGALETELKRAAKEREFEVFYQPQVRLCDETIVGAEALLRWRHPQRGVLLPGAFLHGLKDNRLSEQVGDFVLEEACRQAAAWRDGTGRPFRIGVNLFERQLLRHDQPQRVAAALKSANLAPQDLEIEIIETVMTGSDDVSIRRVKQLRELGVGIAFDDYGTGYASLGLLKRYPITRLKIDRSFVRDLMQDDGDIAIIDLILTLGRRFGLGVVAEGVETPLQAQRLVELGCEEAQGFLFGKAMPAQEFATLLRRPDRVSWMHVA